MSAEEKAKNQAALESHLKNTVRAREEKEVDEEKAAVDPSFDQKKSCHIRPAASDFLTQNKQVWSVL